MSNSETLCRELECEIERLRRRVAELEHDRAAGQREAEETQARQESLLRTVVDNLVEPVFAKDTESRFMLVNAACLRRLKAASANEVIGKTDFDFFPAHQATVYREEELRIIETGEPLINRELDYVDEDGQPFWYLATKVPLRDGSGRIVGLVGTGRDITWQKRTELLLQEANEKLEARVAERTAELTAVIAQRERIEADLNSYLAQIRKLTLDTERRLEEQKAWISKELHDELGQVFTALNMSLAWLREHTGKGDPRVEQHFAEARELVNHCMETVRNLSKSLRPPLLDHQCLPDAVRSYVGEFQQRYGIACEVTASPPNLEVGDPLGTTVFRIVQEALTNVARHARASRCRVVLERDDGILQVQVCDDGVGASPERLSGTCSLGIVGMQERAGAVGGTLRVENRTEGGVRVLARLPCVPPAGPPAKDSESVRVKS